jgi:MFS transporter, ACS family, glucarate transporter
VKSGRWFFVGLLLLTATAGYLCRVNFSTAGVLAMREFGLSQVQMGRIFSAFLLGYALCQIPAGMLADRWGARRVLAIASWWWLAGSLAQACVGLGLWQVGAAGALWSFMALRFLLGVTEAPTYPAAAQGVACSIPTRLQGRANGIVLASIGLGSALAPPLVSASMLRWGWRTAMLISALPALAAGIAWLLTREDGTVRSKQTTPGPDTRSLRRNLFSPGFILLTASYTLQGYVGYIFVFWFYLYLVQERHFDLLQGAFMSSLPWVLSLLSIPLGGVLSDRLISGRLGITWGRRAVPMIGLAGAGALLAVGARAGNAYAAAVCMALATGLVLSVEGPFWATMMEIAGSGRGTAGGIMNMGSNVGGLISPALTPVLATHIGWEKALLVAAALSVIAAVMWLGISPSDPARTD